MTYPCGKVNNTTCDAGVGGSDKITIRMRPWGLPRFCCSRQKLSSGTDSRDQAGAT